MTNFVPVDKTPLIRNTCTKLRSNDNTQLGNTTYWTLLRSIWLADLNRRGAWTNTVQTWNLLIGSNYMS